MSIDLEKIVAIDVHTHAEVGRTGEDGLCPSGAKRPRSTSARTRKPTVEDVAAYYRERNMAAVVFTRRRDDADGPRRRSQRGDRRGRRRERRRADPVRVSRPAPRGRGRRGAPPRRDHNVRGFKFHPNIQAFFPNDDAFYPIYEAIQEAGVPALFHTGHSGIGTGLPGGGGIRLKYSNPMYVDDVAVDFPDLKIVLAHPSFPWQDEAISVALHKQQVYIDLSGWSPKYFPPQLVRYANTQLRDRVLFGSDFPMITPDRWLKDFEQAEFKDEVRPLILKENAARLLGLR